MTQRKPIELPVNVPPHPGRPTYLLADSPVTKRKSFCFVMDPEQNVLYATAEIGDCIDWLLSEEVFSIILITRTQELEITLQKINHNDGGPSWQGPQHRS